LRPEIGRLGVRRETRGERKRASVVLAQRGRAADERREEQERTHRAENARRRL